MRGFTGLLILVALFLVVSFRQGIALYVDWLWFQEVGYTQLFTRSLLYKLVLAVLSGGVLAALLYINLKIAAVAPTGFRFSRVDNVIELPPPDVIDPLLRRLLLPAALFLGLLAASAVFMPPTSTHPATTMEMAKTRTPSASARVERNRMAVKTLRFRPKRCSTNW